MTDTYDITDIRTGDGFDGKRVAVIAAPHDAKAGSLSSLTRFFHEQGFDAQLGYAGNSEQHVLRLDGLSSDAALQKMLTQDFSAWQQQAQVEPRIRIPENTAFSPLQNAPAEQSKSFSQRIRENSTNYSALAYSAGNIGLVFSALYGQGKGEKRDYVKLGAPACYVMASALLYFLNKHRPEPRSMDEVWDSLSPDLLRDDYTPPPEEAEQNRKAGSKVIGHAWEFIQKHPWEVNGILNMMGAGTHMASSLMRGQRTEAMAALSTLTAMAITTFVPEKGKHGKFAEKAFAPVSAGVTMGGMQSLESNHGVFQPFFDAGKKLSDWVQEKPLRAASYIQLAANTGYGVAAMNNKDATGNRKVDYGLLASSGTYIAGNGFQAIATKTKGPSFDDIVTKAADAISHQTDWQDRSPEELRPLLLRVAHSLSKQPEIGHSEKQLAAGMLERLKRERAPASSEKQVVEGFIPTEKDALKRSPFISPHMVEATLGRAEQAMEHAR